MICSSASAALMKGASGVGRRRSATRRRLRLAAVSHPQSLPHPPSTPPPLTQTHNRGIGRGLVEQLLKRDNTVVATARSADRAKELLAQPAASAGAGKLLVEELEATDEASVLSFARSLRSRHGIDHVDLLINNAGIYSPDGRRPALGEFTAADFAPVFAANATGPFLVVQAMLAEGLLGDGSGGKGDGGDNGSDGDKKRTTRPSSLVANVSSIMASNTDPTISAVTPGAFAYRASKAALCAITTTLARDFERDGRGVEAVLLHPGYVKTDMTGGQGYVTVEESAEGLMRVLEDGRPLNGRFYSFSGDEIPF